MLAIALTLADHDPSYEDVATKFFEHFTYIATAAETLWQQDDGFFHDVLHHVEDRTGYLRQASKYLKPGGRFAFVELDAKTGAHRNDSKLQITKEQLTVWMADIGFVLADDFAMFQDKWYVVYARKAG